MILLTKDETLASCDLETIERIALSNKANLRLIRKFLIDNWIGYLPILPIYSAVIAKVPPGHLLIYYDHHNLIKANLSTGKCTLSNNFSTSDLPDRVTMAHFHSQLEKILMLAENGQIIVGEEMPIAAAESFQGKITDFVINHSKVIKGFEDGSVRSNGQLVLSQSPFPDSKLTCIGRDGWLGYADGRLFNYNSLLSLSTGYSAITALTIFNNVPLSGSAEGSIWLGGLKLLALSVAITALEAWKGLFLVARADRLVQCYTAAGVMTWSTKLLDSFVVKIVIDSQSDSGIELFTLSSVLRINCQL